MRTILILFLVAGCGASPEIDTGGSGGGGVGGGTGGVAGSGGSGGSGGPVATQALAVTSDGQRIGFLTGVHFDGYQIMVLDLVNGITFQLNARTGYVTTRFPLFFRFNDCTGSSWMFATDSACDAPPGQAPLWDYVDGVGGDEAGWAEPSALHRSVGQAAMKIVAGQEEGGTCTEIASQERCRYEFEVTSVIPTAFPLPITIEPPD